MESSGKILMAFGLILFLVGLFLTISNRIPIKFGRLPGDIAFEKSGLSVFVPITTMIVLSGLFSLVAWVVSRFHR
jgi:ABC-type Na+ efflux pump permease subunit